MSDQRRDLAQLRDRIRGARYSEHGKIIDYLIDIADLDPESRQAISLRGAQLVEEIRSARQFGLLEQFFKEYGLSTNEGLALMRLAEALMRVPDAHTKDLLIEDKIATSQWRKHFGNSRSTLINLSTLGLMTAGSVLEKSSSSLSGALHEVVKRLGEPVIRAAVGEAMKVLGDRFVLGQTIEQAIERSGSAMFDGFTYSYDMLGEAARTSWDAERYFKAYSLAVNSVATMVGDSGVHENPGVSVKLSALHPRYEFAQKDHVVDEIVGKLQVLLARAAELKLGINIDAEENERLDLSLDVIEQLLSGDIVGDWEGFGVVVQAYSPCAPFVIDWLYALCEKLDRRIMVRLVKGAYWDTEIKRAQMMGLEGFPVFTRKSATDVSYIACAHKLMGMTDRLYPQFATHNAHTVSAVLHYRDAMNIGLDQFEFQRLHGMGEALHKAVMKAEDSRCRIYAPVGEHRELLAYLVRRLLENGANSSFINQIVDEERPADIVASDPFSNFSYEKTEVINTHIKLPFKIYEPGRVNSKGWDLTHAPHVEALLKEADVFRGHVWETGPIIDGPVSGAETYEVYNPARPDQLVGTVVYASEDDIDYALQKAELGTYVWSSRLMAERVEYLVTAANLLEQNFGELIALLIREAGKTYSDCIAELREAVDFLRYYASEGLRLSGQGMGRGIVVCVSPWNFPLAIFTGQIAGALVSGNSVIAKPSNSTPLIAARVIALLHEAGVPREVLQLLPGRGSVIGSRLITDDRVAGVCFTGSLDTAQSINRNLAEGAMVNAMLIAETGGLNAMVVDSTALPEQVVMDVIASAFQSAGQRCSALRMLYIQEDIYLHLLEMLYGAMEELRVGDPWDLSTDVGPVIDLVAKEKIDSYVQVFAGKGKVLKRLSVPEQGSFVSPTVIEVNGIEDLEEEVFGPVLHVASFKAGDLSRVIGDINDKGYGLTFGLHSRIAERVYDVSQSIHAGNIYVNRNQIGAIVESQPFGGEGLSGTGPKAGGPRYVQRFTVQEVPFDDVSWNGERLDLSIVQSALDQVNVPEDTTIELSNMRGVTGEANTLSTVPRGKILCLGPTVDALEKQINRALEFCCTVLALAPEGYLHANSKVVAQGNLIVLQGRIDAGDLKDLNGVSAVCFWGRDPDKRGIKKALAARKGAIIPLITETCGSEMYVVERHLCVNTAAAGGDISLFADSAES